MTTIEDIPIDVIWLILRKVIADRALSEIKLWGERNSVDTDKRIVKYFECYPSIEGKHEVTDHVRLLSHVNQRWDTLFKSKLIGTCGCECNSNYTCQHDFVWLFKKGSFS